MARRIRQDFTFSANGASNAFDFPGGEGTVAASGTFGGGNITLQMQGPTGTWWNVTQYATTADLTLTAANKSANFRAPAGPMRLNLAGATAPSINALVVGVPSNVAG